MKYYINLFTVVLSIQARINAIGTCDQYLQYGSVEDEGDIVACRRDVKWQNYKGTISTTS